MRALTLPFELGAAAPPPEAAETRDQLRARVIASQGGRCAGCGRALPLDVIEVDGTPRAFCRAERVKLQAAARRAAGKKPRRRQREVKGTRRRRSMRRVVCGLQLVGEGWRGWGPGAGI